MASAGVAGKTITISFDLYLISGTIPRIFICDNYRSMQVGDSSIKNKWQRCYLVYTHPGQSSSYNYFTPHFSGVSNCKIKNIKVTLGDVKDAYTEYNRPAFLSDISGLGRHISILSGTTLDSSTPRYDKSIRGASLRSE